MSNTSTITVHTLSHIYFLSFIFLTYLLFCVPVIIRTIIWSALLPTTTQYHNQSIFSVLLLYLFLLWYWSQHSLTHFNLATSPCSVSILFVPVMILITAQSVLFPAAIQHRNQPVFRIIFCLFLLWYSSQHSLLSFQPQFNLASSPCSLSRFVCSCYDMITTQSALVPTTIHCHN